MITNDIFCLLFFADCTKNVGLDIMDVYKTESNEVNNVVNDIADIDKSIPNKKKKKVRGPYKVIGSLFSTRDHIWHHCKTQELAEKMIRKHVFGKNLRIEYIPD